ncbi:unnamed protein product [Lampetra planeri]
MSKSKQIWEVNKEQYTPHRLVTWDNSHAVVLPSHRVPDADLGSEQTEAIDVPTTGDGDALYSVAAGEKTARGGVGLKTRGPVGRGDRAQRGVTEPAQDGKRTHEDGQRGRRAQPPVAVCATVMEAFT